MEQTHLRLESKDDAKRIRALLGPEDRREILTAMAVAIIAVAEERAASLAPAALQAANDER